MKDVQCDLACYSYYGTYRLGLALALYHLLHALLLLGVSNSKDGRAIIQEGFWPIKVVLLLGLAVGSFYIPRGLIEYAFIPTVLVGGVFLLVQAVLLVDLAYSWAEGLLDSAEGGSQGAKVALIGSTALFNLTALGATVGMFFYFEESWAITLMAINAVLVVVISICSVLPMVQEANPSSGLFQSALLGVYSLFVLLSALVSDPRRTANVAISAAHPWLGRTVCAVSTVYAFLAVARAAFSAGHNLHRMVPVEADKTLDTEEEAAGKYNYSLFHLSFAMAALYTILYVTYWQYSFTRGSPPAVAISSSTTSFWVRVGSSWLVAALYLWSLAAPIVLEDRSF